MTKKKYEIYPVVPPHNPKTVSARVRTQYLNCKFWKSSKNEAEIFFYLYFLSPCFWPIDLTVAILSGELFKISDTNELLEKIRQILQIYKQNPKHSHSSDNKKYVKLISAIMEDDSYRNLPVLDDVIDWAVSKQYITPRTKRLLLDELAKTRLDVFKNTKNITDGFLKEQLDLLLNAQVSFFGHTCIFYNDAQELLFPEQNLLTELKNEAVQANATLNQQYIYFEIRELLKWLMQKNYLSNQLTEKFRAIKIESIKENLISYTGCFNSLHDLIKQGVSRDRLLQEALNGRPLYWQYPMSCQCEKDIDNHCICNEGLLWVEEGFEWIENPFVETKRLKGYGRLKNNHGNNQLSAYLGGLTVEMLRHHKSPTTTINCFRIDLVPTKAEINEGLQPYIKVLKEELAIVTADDRIGFLEDPALDGCNRKRSQRQNAAKTNGKLSGESRKETANANWGELKPELLKIAEINKPISANAIANKAVKKGFIQESEVSNTAKKIRSDPAFYPFFKKKIA